jgi:hypothetical protein
MVSSAIVPTVGGAEDESEPASPSVSEMSSIWGVPTTKPSVATKPQQIAKPEGMFNPLFSSKPSSDLKEPDEPTEAIPTLWDRVMPTALLNAPEKVKPCVGNSQFARIRK